MEMVIRNLNLNKSRDAYRGIKKDYDSGKNGFASDFSKTPIAGVME
jgi:hypothetical protein